MIIVIVIVTHYLCMSEPRGGCEQEPDLRLVIALVRMYEVEIECYDPDSNKKDLIF